MNWPYVKAMLVPYYLCSVGISKMVSHVDVTNLVVCIYRNIFIGTTKPNIYFICFISLHCTRVVM